MKIECEKEKISSVAEKSQRVAAKNNSLPILQCLLFIAHADGVKIKSTNIDVGVETTIPCRVFREGVVAVPAQVAANILSALPGKKITLEEKDGNLEIISESSKTTIKSIPPDDFPLFPSLVKENSLTISAKHFLYGIKSVWYSASISSIKPELSAVYIYYEGQYIYFVATDSFRLAEKRTPYKNTPPHGRILVPTKNLIEISKFLEDVDGDVDVYFSKNQLHIILPNTYLTSRLVEGIFPDYRQIIPTEYSTQATVLKNDFLTTLKTANIFIDRFNQLTFKIIPQEKKITLETQNPDIGKTSVSIPALIAGDAIEIRFNHRYVLDCLQSIPEESILLQFSNKNKPLRILGVNNGSFQYIVMPMNR